VAAGYPQRHERYRCRRGRHDEYAAHIDAELGKAALKMMEQNMSAELTTAANRLGSARTLE
jgi:hypothetical protein